MRDDRPAPTERAELPLQPAAAPLVIKTRPAHPRNYRACATRDIRFVVIHCTDGHRGVHKDDDVAAMFARGDLNKRRSCHYVVDLDSATQCVADINAAYQCGRKGNRYGIGIELCGPAMQTREQWLDEKGRTMLGMAARLTADLCKRYGLPPRFVDAPALRAELRGITTHAEVGEAWRQTKHVDPGPAFPLDVFMAAVHECFKECNGGGSNG